MGLLGEQILPVVSRCSMFACDKLIINPGIYDNALRSNIYLLNYYLGYNGMQGVYNKTFLDQLEFDKTMAEVM